MIDGKKIISVRQHVNKRVIKRFWKDKCQTISYKKKIMFSIWYSVSL